ncbi:MAG: Smr/MutS family protein [Desulfuromonadales bacterium]|nr:Smr/MutS family protein [Desulfuromonadales bacterium]
MAKKKSRGSKPAQNKSFNNSPFKDLKGLSAFSPPPEPEKPKKQPAAPQPEEQVSFGGEMDFLGVKPLPGRKIEPEEPHALDGSGASEPQAPPRVPKRDDESLFLEAVGAMDASFKDDWPQTEQPATKAQPRRMRQVERGALKPQAELDLHGLTVAEASGKVGFFLQDALYQGWQTLLIITGKGLHSDDGPVLRKAVEQELEKHRALVAEWGFAPRRLGGDGALVVFLRRDG